MEKSAFSKVAVVIVTHNAGVYIEKCLSSLEQSLHPVHTIVVDNTSSDNTCTISQQFPNVTLIPLGCNVGFGRANNVGIGKALREAVNYVFLLNQDALIFPETIKELVHFARIHHEFGILSPMHLQGNECALDRKFAMYFSSNPTVLSDTFFGRLEPIYDVTYVNAAAWLVSRNCLEKVGGFDPLFFMYVEDEDYCARVLYHGFRIGIVPSVRAIHFRHSYKENGERHQCNQLSRAVEFSLEVLKLKNLYKPFWKTLGAYLLKNAWDILAQILYLNTSRLGRRVVLLAHVIQKMPQIYTHLIKSKKGGTLWF